MLLINIGNAIYRTYVLLVRNVILIYVGFHS